MNKQLELVFDFASPNAYLSYRALPPILARTNATLVIHPCLLGGIFKATGNQPPMIAFGDVQGKLAYEQLETARFVNKHGLSAYKFNPHFPVTTLLLMRGAIAAERDGYLVAYIEAGLKHMWEDGLKMDDPAIFAQAMTEAGLDGERLLAQTAEPEIKQKLIENTQKAVERGAFGIPTFYVGTEMFFGKERLGQVEEELAS
ncbi:MAG: 2-hydroxychromene-2-carboxylate isomerase [Gammaproteobacteria bacterium]